MSQPGYVWACGGVIEQIGGVEDCRARVYLCVSSGQTAVVNRATLSAQSRSSDPAPVNSRTPFLTPKIILKLPESHTHTHTQATTTAEVSIQTWE